jgi:hypothetical protein
MKAVRHQRVPPLRQGPGRERAEAGTRMGDGSMPTGELPDGIAELLLFRAESEGHGNGRWVTNVGRTDRCPSLQDEPSRLVAHYGAGQDL